MRTRAKIAISIPGLEHAGNYFSLRLQSGLSNEPTEFDLPEKIVAVSDIEGNFIAFSRLLIKNGVIDKYFNWTFRDGHLVLVGDFFDRGDQVFECLWLIYSLEEKARKKGGYVHFILGNHEIMNLNGDWRYIHPRYAVNSEKSMPHTALYDGNNELWRWLRTKNIIEKVGDILFVHGGIAEELLQLKIPISEINAKVRPYYNKANYEFEDPLLKLVFNSYNSPFWFRGYYQEKVDEKLIDATLEQYGATKIITGHTLVDSITTFFNNKLINIDTNHSIGSSECLLIKKEAFYKVDIQGKKKKIK